MPDITASYNGTTETGRNAVDRPFGDRAAPSVSISNNAQSLFDYMESLDEQNGRSPYACAEAQALAKLLISLDVIPQKLSKIIFSRPTSNDGYVLWKPCGNCSSWLEKSSITEFVHTGWKGKKSKRKKVYTLASYDIYRIKTDWDQ